MNDREPLLGTLNIGLTEVLKKIVIPWKFLVRFEEEKHIFLPNKIFFLVGIEKCSKPLLNTIDVGTLNPRIFAIYSVTKMPTQNES